jgi:hypothetical protein
MTEPSEEALAISNTSDDEALGLKATEFTHAA